MGRIPSRCGDKLSEVYGSQVSKLLRRKLWPGERTKRGAGEEVNERTGAHGRANGWPGQISRVRTISSTYGRTGHGRGLRGRRYVQNDKLSRAKYGENLCISTLAVNHCGLAVQQRLLSPGADSTGVFHRYSTDQHLRSF